MARQKSAPVDGETTTLQTTPDVIQDPIVAEINKPKTEIEGTANEFISSLLKGYPDCSALYIDNQGGVFLEGTNQKTIGSAILYQNPFYKPTN